MEFIIKSGNPEKQRTACVIVGITEPRRLTPEAKAIDQVSKKHLSNLIRRGDMDGKAGQSLVLYNVPGMLADRVLLVGCGKERDLDDNKYKKIIENSIKELNETGATEAVSYLSQLPIKGRDIHWKVRQAVEVTNGNLYQFNEFKSKKKRDRKTIRKLVLTVPSRRDLPAGDEAINEGLGISKGVKLTRDLANRPANVCTPSHLALQAKQLAKTYKAIKVNILEAEEMKNLGMNSLLSVSAGSAEPPKLITLEYFNGLHSRQRRKVIGLRRRIRCWGNQNTVFHQSDLGRSL